MKTLLIICCLLASVNADAKGSTGKALKSGKLPAMTSGSVLAPKTVKISVVSYKAWFDRTRGFRELRLENSKLAKN
jgi:hypothetical protein